MILEAVHEEQKIYQAISEVSQGNMQALSDLYVNLKKPVYLLALSILKSESLAEDVVQETFIKILKHAEKFKSNTHARAWILKIGRNTALDILRQSSHEQPLWDDCPQVCSEFQQLETSIDFLRATQSFKEIDKSILVLHIFGGLAHKQIAKIVDTSVGNVRIRYHRAIGELKKQYKQSDAKGSD